MKKTHEQLVASSFEQTAIAVCIPKVRPTRTVLVSIVSVKDSQERKIPGEG